VGRSRQRALRRSHSQRRLRAFAAGAASAAGLLTLSAALGELALRARGQPAAFQIHDLGRWRMTPNLQDHPIRGNREAHAFRLSTNREGLRTALPPARTAGTSRVALLGDSVVFGWGVDDGQTLADGMTAALPGVEVLNAAQPGFSTTQAAWFHQEVVADYRPDRVVLALSMHDHKLVLVSDLEQLRGGGDAAASMRVALARRSRLYAWLRPRLFAHATRPQLLPRESTTEPRVPRVSDVEAALVLDTLRWSLDANGACLTLAVLPAQPDLDRPPGGEPLPRVGLERSRAWAERSGVTMLDIRSCCTGADLVLPYDADHYSAAGNAAVGVALGRAVAALPPCPG